MTDDQRSEYVKDAFKDSRKGARADLLAMHPEIGAVVVPKGVLPLPRGYSARSSAPVALKGLRGTGVPPLPPGYALAR